MPEPGASESRLTFRPHHRLRHAREFQAVFAAKVRKSDGPLLVFTLPNGLGHHRLGLSIGRRIGGAVRRSLLKRHVREAFRSLQFELPMGESGGYDIVVGAHAHTPLPLDRYRMLLASLVQQSHRVWERKERRGSGERGAADA